MCLADRVVTVDGGAHDDDAGEQAEQRHQPVPDNLLIVGDQYPDEWPGIRYGRGELRGRHGTGSLPGPTSTCADDRCSAAAPGSRSRTVKPAADGPADRLPPSSSARSRIPVSP